MKKTEGLISQAISMEGAKKVELIKVDDEKIEITIDGKYAGRFLHYSPKVEGYDVFKDYHRHPIQLSTQNIIVIHHFSDKGEAFNQALECHDMMEENKSFFQEELYKTSAEQFFDQLEGHYCDAFLEEMIIAATKKLAESDEGLDKLSKLVGENKKESRATRALEKAAEAIK